MTRPDVLLSRTGSLGVESSKKASRYVSHREGQRDNGFPQGGGLFPTPEIFSLSKDGNGNKFRLQVNGHYVAGSAGVGKTHLASALCHKAVLLGHQTIFITLFDFTSKLAKAKSPYNLIEYYARVPLLCLDELGYVVPTKEQADAFFQIISKRTEVRTTIVTTNLIPSQWGKIFDSVTASAILDRLSMNGRFIICEGRSYRSKK